MKAPAPQPASATAPLVFTVYGGSFNPVHEGHLAIIEALARQPDSRQVLVVPARRSPFKLGQEPLPAALRWAMLRAVLHDRRRVCLLDIELHRPPPSYTYETLEALGAMLPRARLRLALGWDAYQDFARWRHAERIVADAELLVFARAGTQGPSRSDPMALAARLPAPWREAVRPDGAGTLVTAEGRTVLRFLDLAFPEVAARDILEARRLEQVPQPARALLAEHWRRSGEA